MAVFPRSFEYSLALKSPVPGLFTHILSLLNFSPFKIFLVATTDAKANFIVLNSSFNGFFDPGVASNISLTPYIKSFS